MTLLSEVTPGITHAANLASRDQASSPTHHRRREGLVLSIAALILYGAVALLLDFRYHVYPPDAVSRMANGFYVLYSRDPHLAAVGFVWNPLQSVLDMVPLLLWPLWHAMSVDNLAGSTVSVICMSGAAYQLNACMWEFGTKLPTRLTLTALFMLNPMIIYYAGNGMSEALYIFTAVASGRYLQRWFRDNDTTSLVLSATFLGLCYLARNEAAGIAVIAGSFVVLRTFRKALGSIQARFWTAMTDGVIFLLPVVVSFVGWAVASYVITGQPFQQFTSSYGNTAELAAYGSSYGVQPGHEVARILHEITDIEHMAPLFPLILLIAFYLAWKRHDWQMIAPIAILGGGLGFDVVSYLEGQVFPWYRFHILVIPLEVLLVGIILREPKPVPAVNRQSTSRLVGSNTTSRSTSLLIGLLGAIVAIVLVGPSLITTATGMLNRQVGDEEASRLDFSFTRREPRRPRQRSASVPMLPYIERMGLPDGSVVTDEDLAGCSTTMIVRSTNPKVFVIPNDRDFQRTLDDPLTFHARYILAIQPSGDEAGLEVSKEYPTLYKTGEGFARLVKSFRQTALCPPYRLYRVIGHPNETG